MSVFKVQEAQSGAAVAFEPRHTGVEIVLDHSGLRHHRGALVLTGPLASERSVDSEVARLIAELESAGRVAKGLLRGRSPGATDGDANA